MIATIFFLRNRFKHPRYGQRLIADRDEIILFNSNPLVADSDNDGYSDEWELSYGFNPTDSAVELTQVLPFSWHPTAIARFRFAGFVLMLAKP